MKAMVLTATGPARIEERDLPALSPGPGEVIVSLRAAALNRRDYWITIGKYAGIRTPCVLGSDGAGEVAAVGEGVARSLLGAEVIIDPSLRWGADPAEQGPEHRILGMPDDGTLAEQVRVPAENVHRRPAHLSWEEAAALPLAGVTAYRALRRGRLRPGETVLITGIGGGVATMALMLARHLGARAIVTSGSADKLARAAELGAALGVNHRDPDWERQLAAAAPQLAVDGAGGDTFNRCLSAVRPGGRVVTYGATTGAAPVEVRRIFWKQLDILGSTMGSPSDFAELLALVEAGRLRPVVDGVLPLTGAPEAIARMERSEQLGKLVLRMG